MANIIDYLVTEIKSKRDKGESNIEIKKLLDEFLELKILKETNFFIQDALVYMNVSLKRLKEINESIPEYDASEYEKISKVAREEVEQYVREAKVHISNAILNLCRIRDLSIEGKSRKSLIKHTEKSFKKLEETMQNIFSQSNRNYSPIIKYRNAYIAHPTERGNNTTGFIRYDDLSRYLQEILELPANQYGIYSLIEKSINKTFEWIELLEECRINLQEELMIAVEAEGVHDIRWDNDIETEIIELMNK